MKDQSKIQPEQVGGRETGAVGQTNEVVSAPEFRNEALVADVMSTNVVTTCPDSLLSDAYAAMMRSGVRRLPVVDEVGSVVGIVTLGDVREARPTKPSSPSIYELNYLIASMHVVNVMTHNPYTTQPDVPLGVAARIMSEHKVGGLPVLNSDGQLVGIITESDIFRRMVEKWDVPSEASSGRE